MPRITPLSYEVLVKVFEKTGFTVSRVSGDHLVMTKEGAGRPLIIPNYPEKEKRSYFYHYE